MHWRQLYSGTVWGIRVYYLLPNMERELEQERVTIMAIPQEILGDPVRGGNPLLGVVS